MKSFGGCATDCAGAAEVRGRRQIDKGWIDPPSSRDPEMWGHGRQRRKDCWRQSELCETCLAQGILRGGLCEAGANRRPPNYN